MLDRKNILRGVEEIAAVMAENESYLSELDARNGDGDLGITMKAAFAAAAEALRAEEEDLGKAFLACSKAMNRAAPSTLGTIFSFWTMGAAKALKGQTAVTAGALGSALAKGNELIMEKAGSKPGEKTVLDVLVPAVQALIDHGGEDDKAAFEAAAAAAAEGCESTKSMRSVHGRAAYYGDQSIGLVDGGAVAGQLLFESILKAF